MGKKMILGVLGMMVCAAFAWAVFPSAEQPATETAIVYPIGDAPVQG
jgi:hypothetical protein